MKLRFLSACVLLTLVGIKAEAQFNDFVNYPITVTPHESKDSTRGHFWGYMFGSYYTKLHADSSGQGNTLYSQIPKGSNAFSLQRVYIGYDYFFNNTFSVHAVLAHEENYEDAYTGHATVDGYQERIFYLKYANMEWNNIFKGSKLSVGSITTPSFAITEEPFWGYRSVDRTLMDEKGITGSNDLGVNLGGKLLSKKNDDGSEKACIGYNIMVGNGLGAVPDNYSYLQYYTVWKKYYGDLYVKLMNDKLVLDLYGDGRTLQWQPYHSYIVTGRVFLGYKTKNFNISVLYFEQMQNKLVYVQSQAFVPTSPVPIGGDTVQNNTQSGFSVMAAAVLMRDHKTGDPKLSLFARYDAFNPDVTYNTNDPYATIYINSVQYPDVPNSITESYYDIGLDFQPIKQIHLMPNILYDGVTNRQAGLTSAIQKFDYDMVARVTFYYQFFKN